MRRHTLEQIDACLEGSLDEEGFASLQQELRENPNALDHYCRQAEIHGRLQWELGEPAQSLALLPLRAGAIDSATPAFGLLVLGSHDPQRFDATMGTDFLSRMAELASAALLRLQ